ncbi:GNAT family N-acetyltransferase [Bacillus alkalicellulosilyticus]|uniref:GNAT family N-acetyltransferase n=1 Tax=Alkalihalobacterium alkalicellulosilyticum TaxID=1912214 RepID=UPI0009962E1D|nr:GNAT family N-acetyltransferase [Bacillus alkalicellulosilyticus]
MIQMIRQDKSYDNETLNNLIYEYNVEHFPKDLAGRYEQICIVLKNEEGKLLGGITGDVCWNWVEIHVLFLDKSIRNKGYGTKLLAEIERIAIEKQCDFLKVDTLSFQALGFYQKNGYEIFGSIDNVGRHFTHYYLRKELN